MVCFGSTHTCIPYSTCVSEKNSHWLSTDFVFKATMLKPRRQKNHIKKDKAATQPYSTQPPFYTPKKKSWEKKFVGTYVPKIEKSNPNPNLLVIRTY